MVALVLGLAALAFLFLTGSAGEASGTELLTAAPGGVAVLLLLEVLRGQGALRRGLEDLRRELREVDRRVDALEQRRRPPPNQPASRPAPSGGTL